MRTNSLSAWPEISRRLLRVRQTDFRVTYSTHYKWALVFYQTQTYLQSIARTSKRYWIWRRKSRVRSNVYRWWTEKFLLQLLRCHFFDLVYSTDIVVMLMVMDLDVDPALLVLLGK